MSVHSLRVLDCGTMTMPRQIIYSMEGTDPLTIPIRAYVVTHPEGNVLIDSGLPREAIDDPAYWDWLTFATWQAGPENHVRSQAQAAGIDPRSIRYVVQSHLHFDHIGGIGHFPDAEFVVHQVEWDYAHHPQDWVSEPFYPLADIDRPGVRWRFVHTTPEDREHDLYGDGRIRLIFSPGHSLGQMSVLLRLDDRLVLITGDAADSAAHYQRETLPPYLDLPAVAQSLDNLHRIEQQEGVDQLIFAHDLEQEPELRSLAT